MSKNITQRVGVDAAMFLTMLVSLASGVALWLFIPSGRWSGNTVFLGIEKHLWTDIHIYLSLIFCGVLLLHLALNQKLFTTMVRSMFNRSQKAPEPS
jgi:uncharacterized iron-regulated membrane protein